jgi:hypothetical protein
MVDVDGRRRRWRTSRPGTARDLAETAGLGLYLGGVGPHGGGDHGVVELPGFEGPFLKFVDDLDVGSADRSFRMTRTWLARLRAVVPTPPSRRWIAWTVRRRIADVPVPDVVHDAIVDAIHRHTRPPSGTRVAVVLPPVAKLNFRRFPEGPLLVHLDAAQRFPTFATQARVTTIGVPDPTEVYDGITSSPERRGFFSERHPQPPLVRLLPKVPLGWLQAGATQVASTSPERRVPIRCSEPVALTIDTACCWHRAPPSRTEVIRIETTVLVPLLPLRRQLAGALRTAGGVITTDAGRRVLSWHEGDAPVAGRYLASASPDRTA